MTRVCSGSQRRLYYIISNFRLWCVRVLKLYVALRVKSFNWNQSIVKLKKNIHVIESFSYHEVLF